ncbi:putative acyl-CoA dehydrogenase YngJ [Candidatus Promineifilum breve]|uniref:Acyl-CoA dehydrogenase YngJ n=1 Tax=Candidatus Promineifilum breve TaxID=1806508 RepID=A0A170PJF8_9CHLR|nr:acyl-CoA dehydrogenase family protein [Candidatus Promineifilum breve]CUS05527.2 putative acyl-CoA dehydrogenase YngJ [Candidatus Promineifilum breve]
MQFELNAEQRALRDVVHDFVAAELRPRARHTDETGEFNWPATRKMGPLGLLGLEVPEAYGGAALDAISVAIVIEELGWGCGSTALAIAAHNGLGLGPLVAFGSEAQKREWLPRLTSGQGKLACLSLTEPGAGSDLKGGVKTRAVAEGDSWIIDGAKMWMTNASISDLMVVLCRTDRDALSHILVPSDTPGITIGPPEKKMGLHGSPTHAVTFDEVRVPRANLLGGEGRGLAQTLATLDSGRVGIGALALGLAQAAYEEALKYAQQREAFGQPIANFQAIQWMLADAATEIEAARLMVHKAAWLKGLGRPYSQMASMAKLFATEVSERVCRNAIQIHGGFGYSSEFEVERMYRDTRLMTIGEGTSEIQRLVIARHLLS